MALLCPYAFPVKGEKLWVMCSKIHMRTLPQEGMRTWFTTVYKAAQADECHPRRYFGRTGIDSRRFHAPWQAVLSAPQRPTRTSAADLGVRPTRPTRPHPETGTKLGHLALYFFWSPQMSIRDFLKKQFIDVIHWTEPGDGILAYRYPMQDMEIQNGGQLTVRESQMAAFVNEGTIADIFKPGLYTLNTHTLPILTNLQNWDKAFQSPFKSDVYFFSTRLQINQRWGTPNSITIRDKEFGAVRLRAFGIYSYRL